MPTPNRDWLLAMIEEINKDSHHHSELEPADSNGIQWCWAGHNASHEFEVGIDQNDELWSRSSGPEWDDTGKPMPRIQDFDSDDAYWAAYMQWERETERWVTSEPRKGIGYIGHW